MKIAHSFLAFFIAISTSICQNRLPEGFVYIDDIIPDIVLEIRYCGNDNFVGQPIAGYYEEKCIVTKAAAIQLKSVQENLKAQGLRLKVFDAYRPQRAVDHFRIWARDWNDTLMKYKYYPNEAKPTLFKRGYISTRSGHSRGSTVDLTIIDRNGDELDMGTPWDFFGVESRPLSWRITEQQRENQRLLRDLMMKNGFKPLPTEWWHFTLAEEPFPKTYFDFVIE
ncbi:M15 family metallopeptidase [Sungkyunkwania multivorans]|uniref:D-alanyl-D-alanine dipeptidase n=1 Tax=Sungkyunkwania multivorans TaxID=1173618 RepID=A0ABW3CUV4_9FLAO